jgi:hypothetical protein
LKKTILNALKSNLIGQGKINASDFIQQGTFQTNQVEFYLDDYQKNLFREMAVNHVSEFSAGNGNELVDTKTPAKMKSLHSSSAMAFNIIGNEKVEILPNQDGLKNGTYSIYFEKKLPTIKKSNAPANLDACLVHENRTSIIFCEMKMFEWFEKNGKLEVSSAYHDVERYYDTDAFPVFNDVFSQLKKGGIFRYDALQIMKHTLGIYNFLFDSKVNNSGFSKIDCVTLLNCVWEVTNPKSLGVYELPYILMEKEEHVDFSKFYAMYQPIIQLFYSNLGVKLDLLYLNHREFINLIKMSSIERSYLKRYDV